MVWFPGSFRYCMAHSWITTPLNCEVHWCSGWGEEEGSHAQIWYDTISVNFPNHCSPLAVVLTSYDTNLRTQTLSVLLSHFTPVSTDCSQIDSLLYPLCLTIFGHEISFHMWLRIVQTVCVVRVLAWPLKPPGFVGLQQDKCVGVGCTLPAAKCFSSLERIFSWTALASYTVLFGERGLGWLSIKQSSWSFHNCIPL